MKPTLDQAEFLFKRFPEKTLREWAVDWEMSHENVRLMNIKLGLPTSKKVAYDSEIARQIVEFIRETIRVNVKRYVPRARVLNVVVEAQPDNNLIEVTVTFKVVNTNEVVVFTTTLSRLR